MGISPWVMDEEQLARRLPRRGSPPTRRRARLCPRRLERRGGPPLPLGRPMRTGSEDRRRLVRSAQPPHPVTRRRRARYLVDPTESSPSATADLQGRRHSCDRGVLGLVERSPAERNGRTAMNDPVVALEPVGQVLGTEMRNAAGHRPTSRPFLTPHPVRVRDHHRQEGNHSGIRGADRCRARHLARALAQPPGRYLLGEQAKNAETQRELDKVRRRARFNELAPVAALMKAGHSGPDSRGAGSRTQGTLRTR